jgi:hypothetical protein
VYVLSPAAPHVRSLAEGAQTAENLNPDDVCNITDVRDPQRSPDGKWVAYGVSRAIKDIDKNDSDIFHARRGRCP